MGNSPKTKISVPKKKSKDWTLYIIETENGFLYTGITKDLARRLAQHQSKKKGGAKFFNSSAPKKIIYSKENLNHSEALKLECAIKKLKRADKLKWVKASKRLQSL